jgi:hypothetical protein
MNGKTLWRRLIFTNDLVGYQKLTEQVATVMTQHQLQEVVFGLEPTSNYHKPLAHWLITQVDCGSRLADSWRWPTKNDAVRPRPTVWGPFTNTMRPADQRWVKDMTGSIRLCEGMHHIQTINQPLFGIPTGPTNINLDMPRRPSSSANASEHVVNEAGVDLALPE